MDTTQLLSLHDRQQRIDIEYRNMRREATPEVVRHIALKHGDGIVLYSHLTAANADRMIAEQIAYFEQLRQSFEWKTYDHDTPGDLKDRLIAHGFAAEEPEALLALDIETAPASLLQPVARDVRRIADPDRLEDVRHILETVWNEPHPWFIPTLSDDLVNDPDHLSVYIAYADNQPVSAAWITFHDHTQFAGLWGGATLAEYRGRGYYTALLAVRLQEARQRGVRFLTTTQPFKWKVKK